MPVSRFTTSLAAVTFGLVLAVWVQPATSFAYTDAEQQACTPDAMRLCSEFIPNVDAITACMIQKKAQLSPQCAVFFRRGPEPGAGAPTSIKPVAKKTKTKKPARKKKTDDG